MDNIDSDADRSATILPVFQERSKAAQQRLLTAAQREFARVGFNKATVADLAREANCSVGGFYRRFRDKEALFSTLQESIFEGKRHDIDKFFRNPKRDALSLRAVFGELVVTSYRGIADAAGYFRAFIELTHSDARVWSPMTRLETHQAQHLAELAVKRGLAPMSPDLLEKAHLATRTVNGFIIIHVLFRPEGFSPLDAAVVEQFAQLFHVGMGLPSDAYEAVPAA